LLGLGILPFMGLAQNKKDTPPANWYNLDYKSDGVMGISTEKAYELLKGRKSSPVVVAVIDGGVDVQHEDLKEVVWINKKENDDNGKDDDNNGYIDDKYGWNFIGKDRKSTRLNSSHVKISYAVCLTVSLHDALPISEKAYELLKGRKSSPVVVAVIDGGVDVQHEDLKEVVWINKKENDDNGKDDDNNGYIDDKYGWNFIG